MADSDLATGGPPLPMAVSTDGIMDRAFARARRWPWLGSDVLAVFVWVLLGFSAVAMLAMPGIVWLLAREYQGVPGKFELAVSLSRITFPYLMLVSLVAMLSGLLNARSRFAPGE